MADLPQNVINARTAADTAATTAGQYASAVPTISDELKKQVSKLYNDNQDVLGLFNQGVTNLVQAPGQSYQMFNNVTDPYARERLASQFTATQALPALTAAGQLGQRMGSNADIVQAGTNAFTAQATAAENAANIARQKYQDILNEFQVVQAQKNAEEQLALQRQAAARSGAPSASEKQSAEIKQIIAEAGKLPENQRSGYIIANGYNPQDSNFSGLFTVQPTAQQQATLAKTKAETAKTIADTKVNKSQGLIPDWIPFIGGW